MLAGCGFAAAATPSLGLSQNAKLGSILTAQGGMTLYLFTKDEPNVSNCYDKCAAAWPPLLSEALPNLPEGVPGKLSLVKRKDGASQLAYNGWPLYFWVQDKKAGDTTGQKVGKVWYAVNPAPVVSTSTTGDLGEHLVAANGMTLYLFTKDEPKPEQLLRQMRRRLAAAAERLFARRERQQARHHRPQGRGLAGHL